MMNDIRLHKFNFNPKSHRYSSLTADKRFQSNKRNSRKNSCEIQPLIAADSDSCSEDEIIVHDVRHIKYVNDGQTKNSSLRKLNAKDNSVSNGTHSETKNAGDPFQNCDFVNLEIEEGDSLQSISLKYHCSISDLKRANHLISNQDFYALKYLKIPVKKYGLLTEILPHVPTVKHDASITEETDDNIRIIKIGIGHVGRSPSPEETATFFKRMDEDLVKIMLSTQTQKESLEAAAVALTTPQIQPLVKDPYNTDDCGIQWNYLLAFVIIVAVVVPAIVTLYMYIRSSYAHHLHVNATSLNETFNNLGKLSMKSKS